MQPSNTKRVTQQLITPNKRERERDEKRSGEEKQIWDSGDVRWTTLKKLCAQKRVAVIFLFWFETAVIL